MLTPFCPCSTQVGGFIPVLTSSGYSPSSSF
jgi:hypothetical protein